LNIREYTSSLTATFSNLQIFESSNRMELRTNRLLLRQFRDADIEPLIAMGQDPIVMKHFVSLMTLEETEAMVGRMKAHWEKYNFGVFAIEIPGVHDFAGFIGFTHPRWEAAFTPCIEILWRLIPSAHNKDYCTEGARACLEWGFKEKSFGEVLAFAVAQNIPSWRVMEKIGMKHVGEFEHPMVVEGHELRKHLLYKATLSEQR
jgi:RimJ/RimL family protein N-acetyltransferase